MKRYVPIFLLLPFLMANSDCNSSSPTSTSGVRKAYTTVETGSDGLTIEQRNIRDRLAVDNKPGSIKHLYVISAMSGQVILYSTVRGKVTSGSKRLSPSSVVFANGTNANAFAINFNGDTQWTTEVLGDDGTYGSSGDYLFWFDSTGRYHQQYTQGCIIHISDQPIAVKSVMINIEETKGK